MRRKDVERLEARRKRIEQEMQTLKDQARNVEAEERRAKRALDRDQCLLLGRAQKQDAAKDPRFAARLVLRLHGFLTRDRDRLKFKMGTHPGRADLAWISEDPGYQQRVREELQKVLASASKAPREAPRPDPAVPKAPTSSGPSPSATPVAQGAAAAGNPSGASGG